MDKRFLEECLTEEMSLETIGKLVGRHPSTVSYWLKKHGLDARNAVRHAPKGTLDKEQLEALVAAGLTLREIAERLDRSVATIRHWMGRYGLKTVRGRRQQPAGAPKRADLLCRRHGQTEFVLEGRGYYKCVKCRLEAVSRRRRTIKRTLVEEAGGQCILADTPGVSAPCSSITWTRRKRVSILAIAANAGRLNDRVRRPASACSSVATAM